MSRGRKKTVPVAITVAIITATGAVLVAAITITGEFLLNRTELHATETAASILASNTASIQAPIVESPSPPQEPTQTQTDTPVLPPGSDLLFEDNFIDNRNGWYTASANPNITGGKYTHKATCPADYVSYYCGTYLMVPFSFPKNFKLEIDATILESSVNGDVGIGFQLRRNGLDHYYINYYITQGYVLHP